MLFAPNLAWRDEPLKQRLESLVDIPVIIENDANAAAWGEFRYGVGRDADDMVLVTVGTGHRRRRGRRLPAAARRLRRRRRARATCGSCPTASGAAAATAAAGSSTPAATPCVREARELVASGTPHGGARWPSCAAATRPPCRGHDVTRAAQEGDPAAMELLADLGRWLGEGAASVAAILDPELIVIGGRCRGGGGPAARARPGPRSRRQLTGRGHRPVAEFVARQRSATTPA